MLDIQRYIEFFDFSKKLEERQGGMPISKAVIVTNIMANFCALSFSISIRLA